MDEKQLACAQFPERGDVELVIGSTSFRARLRDELSPEACAEICRRLPVVGRVVHARWSGEAIWLPLGFDFPAIHSEHATSYPAPGDILMIGPGQSEAELLIAYGACRFASRAGQLAGAPILTIRDDRDGLAQVGRKVLQEGALDLVIRLDGRGPW